MDSDTAQTLPMPLLSIWWDKTWWAENPPFRGYGTGDTPRQAVADLRKVMREAPDGQ